MIEKTEAPHRSLIIFLRLGEETLDTQPSEALRVLPCTAIMWTWFPLSPDSIWLWWPESFLPAIAAQLILLVVMFVGVTCLAKRFVISFSSLVDTVVTVDNATLLEYVESTTHIFAANPAC